MRERDGKRGTESERERVRERERLASTLVFIYPNKPWPRKLLSHEIFQALYS